MLQSRRSTGWHCVSSRHICRSIIVQPDQQRCLYKISPDKLQMIYRHIFALCASQNVTAHAQSTSTTHFSCSSKCRRTSLYKSYHRVFDFVKSKSTGQGFNICAAIYVCYKIYNSTNNDVYIKYPPKKLILLINIFSLCTFSNIFPLGGDTPFYLISRRNRRFLFDG